MKSELLFWFAIAFFGAHTFEATVYDWRTWASKTFNAQVEWSLFYVGSAAALIFGFACAAAGWQLPEFSLVFPAFLLFKALLMHIVPTLLQRKFAPGLITAIVLFLPVAGALYAGAAADGVLTLRALVISTVGGLLMTVFPVILLATKHLPMFTP